ncbi:hypothetical protein niasHT_007605 [Heterodera trifolii]|uniref:Mannosyltransferase n=1 Tax=Heterodera trifolii TaxID=157864 RepID=A0ABD2LPN6_9BILA
MEILYETELLLLFGLVGQIIFAPFTKVEESFNVQAIHDMVYHRMNLTQYDHLEFPGVVPRTFAGPFSIASVLFPFAPFFAFFSVENQFHFLFYASRPLPNTFAMALVLLVFQKLLDFRFLHAAVFATVATFLFRFELLLLFGPAFLFAFAVYWRHISVLKTLLVGFCSLIIALILSVLLDSLLWRRWVWPEGEVIRFNVWHNRSSEYGVLPFWWYFFSALPRAMFLSVFLVPFGLLIHQRVQFALVSLCLPAFLFVFLFSFLPHKELRFILYAVPLFNTSVAVFCAWIWKKARDSWFFRFCAFLVALHLLVNAIFTVSFVYASAQNYPGGVALLKLQHKHRFLRDKPIAVHIDQFSAETGISRFLHLYDAWEYNKTENLAQEEFGRFDYILVGNYDGRLRAEMTKNNLNETHTKHFIVKAFHKQFWKKPILPNWLNWSPLNKLQVPAYSYKPKVMVMKRKDE